MRLIPPEGGSAEGEPMVLMWGGDVDSGAYTGHNGEYLINLLCITGVSASGPDIPQRYANSLAERLGEDWEVHNRGSRIEVAHRELGTQAHEFIMETTRTWLAEEVLSA